MSRVVFLYDQREIAYIGIEDQLFEVIDKLRPYLTYNGVVFSFSKLEITNGIRNYFYANHETFEVRPTSNGDCSIVEKLL